MGTTGIKVLEITDELIKSLESYLKKDPITNFYPLRDLYKEEARRKTSWYVGLKDVDITGFLLIYRGVAFQIEIGGDRSTACYLFNMVTLAREDKAIFQVDPELSEIVKGKFPIKNEYATEIMRIKKGEERLFIRQRVELLNESNAFELAKLLIEESKIIDRDNKVIFPAKVTDEDVKMAEEDLRSMRVYAIFDNGRLVSVCLLEELLSYIPEVYWIQDVITSQNYRGRGFATSVVSKAVEDAFKHDSVRYVGLRVRSDNIPAKRLYGKIGFKKHRDRRWLSLNVEGNP